MQSMSLPSSLGSGPNDPSSSKPQVRWADPQTSHEMDDSDDEGDDVAASTSKPGATTSSTTPATSAYTYKPSTNLFSSSTTTTPGTSTSAATGHQPFVPLSSFLSSTPGTSNFASTLASLAGPTAFIRSEGVGENYTSTLGSDLTMSGSGVTGGDGDDEFLPAMADDDYSALLSWQKQSKDDLKVLMDSLSPDQYDRFEAYRRHALPKQGVRKVIQQGLGQQVSMPVAQVVAGVAKVFVGEMVERARAVQAQRRDTGPLSPDHLREAYRSYQQEFGRVGVAQRVRGKRLFVR